MQQPLQQLHSQGQVCADEQQHRRQAQDGGAVGCDSSHQLVECGCFIRGIQNRIRPVVTGLRAVQSVSSSIVDWHPHSAGLRMLKQRVIRYAH